MDTTLSLYFNTDRTYLTVVEKRDNGLWLRHIDSTLTHIDIENIESDESREGLTQVHQALLEIPIEITRVTATLPAESVLVSQFPGSSKMSSSELKKLVNLELRQLYPQFSYSDFALNLIPFLPNNKTKAQMLAVMVENAHFDIVQNIISPLDRPLSRIDISQLNAHNAHVFNYPQELNKNIALLSVQKPFLDFSIIRNGKPLYYSAIRVNNDDDIASLFEQEITKAKTDYVDTIDSAYYFGASLTKEISLSCWETSMMMGFEGKRLNPFRMLKTDLDERTKEYCSRVFHLYPACIGASMPAYYDRILLK